MKIDLQTHFPHPVLGNGTGDYTSGEFHILLKRKEDLKTGALYLHYTIEITEESIGKLVQSQLASVGLFVICQDTYFSKLVALDPDKSEVQFPAGTLNGRVILRPLVWANQDISGFSTPSLHPEFGSEKLNFAKGAIIALDSEYIVNVGREKLAPMESIFELARNDAVPSGTFSVNWENDKITIEAEEGTYQYINLLRENAEPVVFNSIYLPVVMNVLSLLQAGEDVSDDWGWYKIFKAKCDDLGIDVKTADILESAQKLLKSPFERIRTTPLFAGLSGDWK